MIEIYTKDNCSFCDWTKKLLNQKQISFNEYKLDKDFTKEILLEKYPNAKTFPVIVIDGYYIGGYTNLVEHFNNIEPELPLLTE